MRVSAANPSTPRRETGDNMLKTISAIVAAFFTFPQLASADPGVYPDRVVLGMSAPLSGPNGAYGVEMRDAALACLAGINADGGVNGRRIDVVALDDGYETEKTVANTKELINKRDVFALFAFYGSSPTKAAMDVFSAAQVPLVGTISGAEFLRTPVNRHMFHVRASYNDETAKIVKQLVTLGLKNIAILYQDDGFGQAGLEGAKAALKKAGLEPSAVGTVARNSLDVAAAVAAISKVTPQAVIMVTLYKPTAAFVRAMRKAEQYPMWATLSPVGADLLVKELGDDALGVGITQVMPYPWNDTVPVVREYQQAIKSAGNGTEPSYYGLEGCVNAKIMAEALRRAGRDLSRERLVGVLENFSYDLGGYKVGYRPSDHNGSQFVEFTVIGTGGKILR